MILPLILLKQKNIRWHNMNIEKLIYKMLTTSTGIALCDSGGENGRNWQRNQLKSLADFKAEPEAEIELSRYNNSASATANISVFHYLTRMLSLDDICLEFNRKKVSDWEGDIYGVSRLGQKWINKRFITQAECWNTYNWDCPLSQTLQGCNLISRDTNEQYVLIQIHQGADVRGGYTDAKLFKVTGDYFLSCDLSCEYFAWYAGDCVDNEGQSMNNDELKTLAIKLNVKPENSITLPAEILY